MRRRRFRGRFNAAHVNSPGPSGAASFTLAWDLPTLAADGSSLLGIAWQRIEYGVDGVAYPYSYYIEDGFTTTATISSLSAGSYYVRIVQSDAANNQSYPSNAIIKVAV